MTTSSRSTPLLVRLPFRGIPISSSVREVFGALPLFGWNEDTYPSFLHDDGMEMDLSVFIYAVDPTKVKVVEREHDEGEKKLLESTIGHVVPLLPVALAHSGSELEVRVDKLFDEGGSADQGDSAADGGHDAEIELVTGVENIAAENVIVERPKRQRKKRPVVTDASGSSHPLKKLRRDNRTSSGVATRGKSPSVLKELLASSILNVEVGLEAVAIFPLITSSISATLGREGGDPTDSITGPNLRTIGPSERFVISLDSSYHSSTNAFGAEVDSIISFAVLPPVMTEAVVTSHVTSVHSIPVPETGTKITSPVHASMFHNSDYTETARPDVASPSNSAKQDLLMGSQELNIETLHKVFVYNRIYEIENLKAQLLLKEAEATEAVHLRALVSAAEATKKMHADEIDALKQRNVALENVKDSLDGKVTKLQSLISAKGLELKDLNVHALPCSSLRDQVSGYERLKEQIEEFQDAQMNIVNNKVVKLDADILEMALHLEEKFYPYLLTTISGRRWILTRGLKLAIVKCLNSPEYLMTLGSAISRAIEKGMQSRLSAGIDYWKAGRSLADVVDKSVADIINLIPLEGSLADAPGMSELHPDIKQLTLPIHRAEDQVVIGETSLSFALSVANSRVERIRKSAVGASNSVPTTVATTTALSTTFASTSSIPLITIEDYEIVNADSQEDAQDNV
ncbi:hypothetical protein Tco_0448544 [Tanacetum coccineum]